MTISEQLISHFPNHYRVLILDNEVTADAFVIEPPLPWVRLMSDGGPYLVNKGYPTVLDLAEADREELNWDAVDNLLINSELQSLDEVVHLIAIGNNAGQGMPLAKSVPQSLRSHRGVVIFGSSLPEQSQYEALGYSQFCARTGLLSLAIPLAAGLPIALAFINTIEHNNQNYHAPWPG